MTTQIITTAYLFSTNINQKTNKVITSSVNIDKFIIERIYSLSSQLLATPENYLTEFFYDDNRLYQDPKYMLIRDDIFLQLLRFLSPYYRDELSALRIEVKLSKISDNTDLLPEDIIYAKKIVCDPDGKIIVIGDIHSSLHSLWRIIDQLIQQKYLTPEFQLVNPKDRIIFLGDLLDRGPYSIEVLVTALLLKYQNFNQVDIINGNHEDYQTYNHFITEMEYQFEEEKVIEETHKFLHFLPTVIFGDFGNNKIIQFNHGAIHRKKFREDALCDEKDDSIWHPREFITGKKSYLLLPEFNNYTGLKWGDFTMEKESFIHSRTHRIQNSYDCINNYLQDNQITALITGHQDIYPLSFQTSVPISEAEQKRMKLMDLRNKKSVSYYLYGIDLQGEEKVTHRWEAGKDFQALCTSTAVVSKFLPEYRYDTYLILSAIESEDSHSSLQESDYPGLPQIGGKRYVIKYPDIK